MLNDFPLGAKCEVHQMPQMGPREHGQRVSSVRAVGDQRQRRPH